MTVTRTTQYSEHKKTLVFISYLLLQSFYNVNETHFKLMLQHEVRYSTWFHVPPDTINIRLIIGHFRDDECEQYHQHIKCTNVSVTRLESTSSILQ